MRIILLTVTTLVCLATTVAAAGWNKAYFGATKPGSWATVRTTTTIGPPTTSTTTRLNDLDGRVVLEDHSEYTDKVTPPATMRYELAKGFNVDRDLIDYLGAVVAASAKVGTATTFDIMPDVTIKGISSVPPFAATATFKGTETVGGKLSDHYSYTRAGDPYTETGDVWLNAGVPFGVVKQTTTTTDAAGKVMWTTESLLVSSGSKPVPAATTTATAPASMTLQAAYAAGLVVINVEIAASDKRGDRMQFVLETAEKSLTVTMPAAATTLLVESPFATLAFRPATAQTFVLTPEKPATVAVNQLGEDRIVAGKFAISKFEGRPIFGGVITTGTVK